MGGQLHIFFFPLMAHGHMLPTIDMAKLFSSRGVKVTLITTHHHSPMFFKSIQPTRNLGFDISIQSFKFPALEAGLPEETQSLDQAIGGENIFLKFIKACKLLQPSLEQLLEEYRPHALVADMLFPWSTDAAAKFGIQRLVFHGSSYFAMCAEESLRRNKPFKNLNSDSDVFFVPGLPHQIKLTRGQIFKFQTEEVETELTNHSSPRSQEVKTELRKHFEKVNESAAKSYGVVVNSFYELEPDYADYYKNVLKIRAWHIGPFLLCNKESNDDMSQRGEESAIDAHECLKWLDSKDSNSVVYMCFGSMTTFKVAQLHEIAMGLESSGQEFIWVVRNCADESNQEKWFPEGFEKRVFENGKGLIIKGWAPQVLILQHKAVGAFVSHCGWNSTLEGVSAGVPIVTWPMFAEQFYNEKLVTDVLRSGVGVGSKQWSIGATDVVVKRTGISNAICRVMVGDEALEIRGRAMALKMIAEKTVEEGGSSYVDLSALLEELSLYHSTE